MILARRLWEAAEHGEDVVGVVGAAHVKVRDSDTSPQCLLRGQAARIAGFCRGVAQEPITGSFDLGATLEWHRKYPCPEPNLEIGVGSYGAGRALLRGGLRSAARRERVSRQSTRRRRRRRASAARPRWR